MKLSSHLIWSSSKISSLRVIHVVVGRVPKIGDAGAHSHEIRAWLNRNPLNHSLTHVCFAAEFGRSRSNNLSIGMGRKTMGDAGITPLYIITLIIDKVTVSS